MGTRDEFEQEANAPDRISRDHPLHFVLRGRPGFVLNADGTEQRQMITAGGIGAMVYDLAGGQARQSM
jgi:hypothetical protein